MDFMRIGQVSKDFGISSRTLRYYEEIGILKSHREKENDYRCYDKNAIRRLQQILILKEIRMSITDIRRILDSDDISESISIFKSRLKELNDDLESILSMKHAVEAFLLLIESRKTSNRIDSQPETNTRLITRILKETVELKKSEDFKMTKTNLEKLSSHEVRIIKMPPMRVASCVAVSTQPENDSWNKMVAWLEKKGVNDTFSRKFGFDTSRQKPDNPNYGYEVWVVVDDVISGTGEIVIKNIPEGLYAVTTVTCGDPYIDIPKRWNQLRNWVADSIYERTSKQSLEEHLYPGSGKPSDGFFMQLDLYIPISK